MIVLQLNACPPGVRGDVTKWLMEVSTGVYVGQLSLRAREALWDRLCKHLKTGSAVMVYSARTEQGFDFHVHNTTWQPVDFDGITLMRRPPPAGGDSATSSGADRKTPPDAPVPKAAVMNASECDPQTPPSPDRSVDGSRADMPASAENHCDQAGPKDGASTDAAGSAPEGTLEPNASAKRQAQSARPLSDSPRKRHAVSLPYRPWPEREPLPLSFTVLDMETTGLDPDADAMIEIACVRVREGTVSGETHCLVQCDRPLPEVIRSLTGLTDADLNECGIPLREAVRHALGFLGDDWIVGHNIAFDISFLLAACKGLNIAPPQMHAIDTVYLARRVLAGSAPGFRLETLAQHLKIGDKQLHRALPDARLTARLYLKLNEIATTAN